MRLSAEERARIRMAVCDRPGATLLDLAAGSELLFLVDAVRSGAPLGSLHRLEVDAVERAEGALSSHGFGLVSALALGGALGNLPSRVVLYAIEIGNAPVLPGGPLSAEVECSVGRAVETLAAEIRRYLERGDL
jgi:hydrogenase maturation protease